MDKEIILTVVQIVFLIAAAILIFIGLRISIKKLDKEKREKAIPKATLSKSLHIIIAGICCYALSRFATNSMSVESEKYSIFGVLIQSLWEAIVTLGFTAFIPYILNRLRGPGEKKKED